MRIIALGLGCVTKRICNANVDGMHNIMTPLHLVMPFSGARSVTLYCFGSISRPI
jgi:hypothetical protein